MSGGLDFLLLGFGRAVLKFGWNETILRVSLLKLGIRCEPWVVATRAVVSKLRGVVGSSSCASVAAGITESIVRVF